jgi:hypothetical protein
MVVAEEPAKPVASTDAPKRGGDGSRERDDVAQPLVVPLLVVVRDVLAQDGAQVGFAERDDLRETLALDGPHEALSMGVQIRRARGE